MSAALTSRARSVSRKLAALAALSLLGLMLLVLTLPSAPLFAQKRDDRVELIMADLPPAGSRAYNEIKRHAGDATGQVLTLTNCEVWRVRRSRVPALMRAAKAHNAKVRMLDDSWNNVFQPMPDAHRAMDATQKQMVDLAMKSPSTAAVGMMAAPPASMVEYALTKDMGKPTSTQHPMTIKIALNQTTTVTAVRRSVVVVGNRCTWHGVVESTGQPVTIMWWSSGRITGSIQHGNRVFQLKHMGKDMIGIVETMLDKIPDEHAEMSPDQMQEMRRRASGGMSPMPAVVPPETPPAVVPQFAPPVPRKRPDRSDLRDQQDAADASSGDKDSGNLAPTGTSASTKTSATDTLAPSRLAAIPSAQRGADTPTITQKGKKKAASKVKHVIDVLVAYTPKAAAHYGRIETDLIELAVEETNRSFIESKIDNVEVRIVHTHLTQYDETGGQHFDHLWRMVDRGNGYMEEIPPLRDQKKADVVILIVHEPQGCGLATRVGADSEEAYAVVHHECAATSYSLAHEIGHIIGTRHNRPIDTSPGPFPYGHGFVGPDLTWRSMMSYRSSCSGCPRLPMWSTPVTQVKGQPAGDEMSDNARVIREQAGRVAAFR